MRQGVLALVRLNPSTGLAAGGSDLRDGVQERSSVGLALDLFAVDLKITLDKDAAVTGADASFAAGG